ncbi:hypothetical protein [Actinoplanes sp. DH11]|uniref:hypothetical protein n=1 Tax=Actinoplanes sp. DH11 TaxID=2857011 RepID=UPI001E30AA0D|nr:hypothetical protein [Actinoplanes sp. DH11]
MAGFPPEPGPALHPGRPRPAAAYRLVIFAFDGALLAGPAGRWAGEAAMTVMDRLSATPGGPDHRYAAVVYGEHEVRVVEAGTPAPWDLRLPHPGRPRTDGAAIALAGTAAEFLAEAPAGLPAGVDILGLTAPGDRLVCPDDLRVLLFATAHPGDVATEQPGDFVTERPDDLAGLADTWWAGLAALRARRRQTELLR